MDLIAARLLRSARLLLLPENVANSFLHKCEGGGARHTRSKSYIKKLREKGGRGLHLGSAL
jgi:hypothetical protein